MKGIERHQQSLFCVGVVVVVVLVVVVVVVVVGRFENEGEVRCMVIPLI